MLHPDSFRLCPQFHPGCKDEETPAYTGVDEVAARHVADFELLEPLIREGASLKREIDAKTARLRSINLRLTENVLFKNGQRTAYLIGGGYKVRIRLHENITWDQEKIAAFRKCLPRKKFVELFKMIYEPISKKAIDGFIANADKDLANGLTWCMSVKPGAPQLSYERLD